MALELPYGIKPTNPTPVDSYYGTYTSIAAAKAAIAQSVRYKGLTVGIEDSGSVKEYWWKSGVTDADLVEKTSGGTSPNTVRIVGTLDASTATDFPTTTKKGNAYEIIADGDIHNTALYDGSLLIAAKDNPLTTDPNDWIVIAKSREVFIAKTFDATLTAYTTVTELNTQNYDMAHGYFQGSVIVCASASTYTRYEKYADSDTSWMYYTNANGWMELPQT